MTKRIEVDGVKIKKDQDQNGKVKLKKNDEDVPGDEIKLFTLDQFIEVTKRPDVQIITKENPTCYWYWDGRQYRRYCW